MTLARRVEALVLAALLAAGASAQDPGAPPERGRAVLGVAREPSGQGIAADLALVPLPQPDLPALQGELPPEPPRAGRSAPNGVFRIGADGPGVLLATTPRGLGGIVAAVPGRVLDLRLQPMAAVGMATFSEPFTIWPAWIDPVTERRHHLPPQRGAKVLLPAGTYEAWFAFADGFRWQRLRLRSGLEHALAADPAAVVLERRGDHVVHPLGFPQVTLLGPDTAECTLLGGAVRATLSARPAGGGPALPDRPVPNGVDRLAWPPAETEAGGAAEGTVLLRLPCTGVPAGATAFGFLLEGTDHGSYRVLARGTADASGAIGLHAPSAGGDQWLLVVASGRAPWTAPRPADERRTEVALTAGRSLRCEVVDERGSPVAGVPLLFVPEAGPPATVRAFSDELGRAELRHVGARGTVVVAAEDFLNDSVAVTAATGGPVRFRLDRGATVRGRAVVRGEATGRDIAVTLRDPSGRLFPPDRTVATAPDGSFEFSGLPADRSFLLFASRVRGGLTWSAKQTVVPGAPVELELVCEDPQLLPPGEGRGQPPDKAR